MNKEQRSIKAKEWYDYMADICVEDTELSIQNSIIYRNYVPHSRPLTEVIPLTTERAVKAYPDCTILNFASFIRPGGGFLNGAMAQEEALCHVSNLYNILERFRSEYNENFKNRTHDGLYENFAIYTPDVVFELDNRDYLANVITCAAPNISHGIEDYDKYINTLETRIKFILDIAETNNVKVLVLGAFGCGVFGNDPSLVAEIFKRELVGYRFDKVIFAIPPGNGNYEAFKKVFNE